MFTLFKMAAIRRDPSSIDLRILTVEEADRRDLADGCWEYVVEHISAVAPNGLYSYDRFKKYIRGEVKQPCYAAKMLMVEYRWCKYLPIYSEAIIEEKCFVWNESTYTMEEHWCR